VQESFRVENPHLLSLDLDRLAGNSGMRALPGFLRQEHYTENLVDGQTQRAVAAFSPPTQDDGRLVASIGNASLRQHLKVEYRQRFAAVLRETDEMGL
jgi:hypothetical protein